MSAAAQVRDARRCRSRGSPPPRGGVWRTLSTFEPSSVVIERVDDRTGAFASVVITDADCPSPATARAYSERGVIAYGSECAWLVSYEDGMLRQRQLGQRDLGSIGRAFVHGDRRHRAPSRRDAARNAPAQDGHGELLVDRVPFAADRCALDFANDEGVSCYAP